MANVIKHKRGSGSDPSASDLVVGEVAIRTDVGKLFTKMDNGSVAEIAGGGSDIAINTLSSSSGTGGGSATFNGSAYRFTLSVDLKANGGLVIESTEIAVKLDASSITGTLAIGDGGTGATTATAALTALGLSNYAKTLIDDADAAAARTTLGLGSIATQAANSVAITGGSITNLTTFDGITIDGGSY